jgi:hypothetical protein
MNRFYNADPQLLATIHNGALRSTRRSHAPLNPSTELHGSESNRQEPTTLADQFNLRRRKSER